MKEKKRNKIKDVANKLFSEKGFENTTTRDLAEAAGISNAALYYYFQSKEDLLYRIIHETISTGLSKIKEIEQSENSPKEKLFFYIEAFTKYYTIYPDRMKLLGQVQNSLTPTHNALLDDLRREYVKILVRILKDLKKQGQISDIDTTICAFAFFGMVAWTYRWYNPKGKVKIDALVKIITKIFTQGIFE
ncbi:MAG: TetR family transcriptional regulator [Deltaproteobacteria bacterium]|nr:TetR family transcriptional regulator [Deltaproteobacteria bacterium]